MNENRGILVGANERQEWLLAWWWDNYRRRNDYPVCFVDFGLSEKKKRWCKERGQLISLRMPPLFVRDRGEVDGTLAEEWEKSFPDTFWESREAWFKKAQACLESPYDETIWIDLDCEIVKPLEGLWGQSERVALAKDFSAISVDFPIYNSGVIVFQKNDPLIVEWAKQSIEKNALFRGDQDVLSQIIADEKLPIHELDPMYNWSIGRGERKDVVIYHWLGDAAKSVLQNKLILARLSV